MISYTVINVKYNTFYSPSRNSPGAYSLDASGALGLSEKTFLNPKKDSSVDDVATENVPSLDDFDKEIEIFRVNVLKKYG